jgi:hypothetical protein
MTTRMKFPERRQQRREEASERATARETRGDAGQLKRLEHLGFGECREAVRIRKKLDIMDPGPLKGAPV